MRKIFGLILVIVLGAVIYLAWNAFPMISGYGAKNLCSCVFVANRAESDILSNELNFFPVRIGSYSVNRVDSTVTGSVFGLAKQKAIYRKGFGCTLVNGLTEEEIRRQPNDFPSKPDSLQDTGFPIMDSGVNALAAIDKSALQKAVSQAFVETDIKNPARTRAVIVLYKGQLVAEQYAPGFNAQTRLMGWSMTKSVMSALFGILVKKGLIDIHRPAPEYEWSDVQDERNQITTLQLLQQTSGLNFEEVYSRPSEVTRMLFREGNMGAYTASLEPSSKPGTVQYYSSGNTNILSSILRRSLPRGSYHSFPYKELFYKVGMHSAIIETDASGNFVGSSYMYATARDWARFGQLYLNKGRWRNEQVLPENWVSESVKPALRDSPIQYGYQWWLNTTNAKGVRKYPSLPEDLFYADGYESQYVFVIPSSEMVIVRLGLTQGNYFNEETFVGDILRCVKR